MKRIGILLILLAIPLALGQPALDAALTSYQPVPAQPGDTLDVYIRVANSGDDGANNVLIETLDSAAFTPQGQTQISAGTILPGSSFLARFSVRVDRDAPAGDNALSVRFRSSGMDWQERTVTIPVQPQDAAVFIDKVELIPSSVAPGSDAEVEIGIENQADARLRDVSITLGLAETPFTPLGGTARRTVAVLNPRSSTSLTFDLAADADAAPGVYRVPVTITFLDEQGNEETQEDMIGLRVDAEADLIALLDEVSRTPQGVEVSVRFVNKGLAELRFVETTVQDGESYDVRPEDERAYLGNIESDDWETLRFTLTTTESELTVPIAYTYRDAFNNELSEETSVTFGVPVVQQSFGWLWALIVIGGIVGLVVWWRKR